MSPTSTPIATGETPPRESQVSGSVDPLAFLVGPVEAVYGSDPAKTTVADLNTLYRPQEKGCPLRSRASSCGITAEAFAPLSSPAQGGTGLLSAVGPIKLHDVTIDSKNSYATVLVISLDGQPLARTARALVQVGTRARPTGWSDHAVTFTVNDGKQTVNGRQIDDYRNDALGHRRDKCQISVRNSNLTSATLLDINGNARKQVPVRRVENAIEVELPTRRDLRRARREVACNVPPGAATAPRRPFRGRDCLETPLPARKSGEFRKTGLRAIVAC